MGGAEARSPLSKFVARKGSIFGVKATQTNELSWSDLPAMYSVWAAFRVWRCELLRNRAKFCTGECYSASRRLFSKAVADGRLELILANERERARSAAVCANGKVENRLEGLFRWTSGYADG